ncbi:MAG: polyamine aminopropyltransferase [Bdellovibrionales bacterium]|nr:polyamine aminopropyltransferase [Bdellovibrionales bacterium]
MSELSQHSPAEALESAARPATSREIAVLGTAILITSVCAIVYELLVSTLSSYLLGSSVLHFSLTIGLFMTFMGVGAFWSKFIDTRLLDWFIFIEQLVGLIGGCAAFLLYLSFSLTEYYYLVAFLLIAAISTCVGLEIPLVTRELRKHRELKDALANILAIDYLGALIASILFPIVLVPYLGLMRTAFLMGMLNVGTAIATAVVFRTRLTFFRFHLTLGLSFLVVLGSGFLYSFHLIGFYEQNLYQDEIIHSEQSSYQRIILTRFDDDIRLYLNGSLQFSTIDEYRYHETLTHIPLGVVPNRENILILGGGDGLAAREALKYPDVQSITLVDIDERMTTLAAEHPILRKLNAESLSAARVKVINQDAWEFLATDPSLYSAIIIDLPDPDDFAVGKLYTQEFYRLAKRRLAADGVLITQASSPFFAREPFWCIHHTLEAVFSHVQPLTLYVPSFGPWGFHLASGRKFDVSDVKLVVPTRFLNAVTLESVFTVAPDEGEVSTELNRLDNQHLVTLYEQSLDDWN